MKQYSLDLFLTYLYECAGIAIVLPPALAVAGLAAASALAECYSLVRWARRCQESYPVGQQTVSIFLYISRPLFQTSGISKQIFWNQKICFEKSEV